MSKCDQIHKHHSHFVVYLSPTLLFDRLASDEGLLKI